MRNFLFGAVTGALIMSLISENVKIEVTVNRDKKPTEPEVVRP